MGKREGRERETRNAHVCSVMSNSWHHMDCRPPGSSVHGISRQEYWSGLPFPPPGDLPDPGIKPKSPESPALAGGFVKNIVNTEPPGKPKVKYLPANAGGSRDMALMPGSGRSPGGGHGNSLQYSCPENSMDRRA